MWRKIHWTHGPPAEASASRPQGVHNQPGYQQSNRGSLEPARHSLAHLKVIILEQIRKSDEEYCREREKYFIRKFDTHNNGINREW